MEGRRRKKLNLFFLVTDAKKLLKKMIDQLGKMLREKKKI